MFCAKCGKENKDDAGFCIYCGAGLAQKVAVGTEQESPKTQGSWMRIAAAVLGACGGMFGLVNAAILVMMGYIAWATGSNSGDIFGRAVLEGLLSIVGIVGAVQATQKPKVAGVVMVVAGILTMVAGAWPIGGSGFRPLASALSYVPLISGGIVSLFAWRRWGDIKENLKQEKKGGVPKVRSMNEWVCRNCGSQNKEGLDKCIWCGADLK